METITLNDYIHHLEELLTQLKQIADENPPIKLKSFTETTPIYPATREDMETMVELMHVKPITLTGVISADFKLADGYAYAHYKEEKNETNPLA